MDDEQNVIEVTNIESGLNVRKIEILIGIIGAILVPVLLCY